MSSVRAMAVALAAGGVIPSTTLAIVINNAGTAPFAPVPSNADTFVGRIQDERLGSAIQPTHLGTGSLIAPGIVLTASHVINEGDNVQHFERFELGGVSRAGLGVRHINFDKFNTAALGQSGINDVGLILIPNMQPGGPLGQRAAAGENPGPGSIVDIVGFTGVAAGNNTPLRGRATINAMPNGVTTSELVIDRPASGSHLQGGDSGGPMIMTNAMNQRVIIGVIAGGRTAPGSAAPFATPVDYCTRVNAYADFINGEGAVIPNTDASRWNTLNRYTGGSQRWKLAPGAWNRGSNPGLAGNGAVLPTNLDIAILDPTANPDTNIQVDIDGAFNDDIIVGGLLNDVTLMIQGAGGVLEVRRDIGGLNSGSIVVRDGGYMQANWSLDNQGEITLFSTNQLFTQMRLGTSAPNMGSLAFNNAGVTNVLGRGQLVVSNNNGPLPSGAIALNRQGGQINVMGTNALAVTDGMINQGIIEVAQQGVYQAPKFFENQFGAQLNIRALAGPASITNVDNRGDILVEPGCFMTMKQLVRADNAPALLNHPTGRVKVQSNPVAGLVIVEGTVDNRGLIHLDSNGAPPTMVIRPGPANTARTVENTGTITFNTVAGPGGRMRFEGMSFYEEGDVNGIGQLEFTGSSDFVTLGSRAAQPLHDTRSVGVVFDAAIGLMNAPVAFEAACFDGGIGPGGMFGFNDTYSFESLCILNGSSVKLEDIFASQTGDEAIYVKSFGIQPGCTLDLNGIKLYYMNLDMDCGGLGGMFENGMPIQIPTPASGLALAAMTLFAAGRRRRN